MPFDYNCRSSFRVRGQVLLVTKAEENQHIFGGYVEDELLPYTGSSDHGGIGAKTWKKGSERNFLFSLGRNGEGPHVKLKKSEPGDDHGFYDSGNDGWCVRAPHPSDHAASA